MNSDNCAYSIATTMKFFVDALCSKSQLDFTWSDEKYGRSFFPLAWNALRVQPLLNRSNRSTKDAFFECDATASPADLGFMKLSSEVPALRQQNVNGAVVAVAHQVCFAAYAAPVLETWSSMHCWLLHRWPHLRLVIADATVEILKSIINLHVPKLIFLN